MPVRPDPSLRRRPVRFWLGGGLVLLLAAAVMAVLPFVLITGPPRTPTPSESEPSTPPTAMIERTRAARPATQPARTPTPRPLPRSTPSAEPETTSGAPVIERRRVQEGPESPIGEAPGVAPQAASPDEWDRSEDARQRGVERFGGTPQTESAVDAGLAWLAAHQSPDGTWDRFAFNRQCPANDRCPGVAVQRTEYTLKAGLTGLTLLAFLGAGHTDREGPYADVVRAAVDALLKLQQPHGGFSHTDGMAGYNDSVATLALAEYYALTREARVAGPLERALTRLVESQQALGGWDYLPTPETGRNDTSITAWMVQALQACAAVGLDVPRDTLVRAALHFVRATERDGRVRYADAGTGFKLDANMRPAYRYGPGMVAAGLTAEQMLGWRLDGVTPLRQRALLLADPPSAAKARGRDTTRLHSEYYWYYGTLAMFQRGGEDWERWNARLRDAILPLQNRELTGAGRKRHAYGSWPPFGQNWGLWGRMGSRVYTTAICTLTLEIYYRHTPTFLRDRVLFTTSDWRAHLRHVAGRERRVAVDALAQLRVEIAEPVLVDLLSDDERSIALSAAEALAWLDSPMGVPLIDEVITTLPPWERRALERALARGRALAALGEVRGRVRLYDPVTDLATLDLPRSYVGMNVTVMRDGHDLARMRVIQRFSGRKVAVAQLLEGSVQTPPERGDPVVAR